MDTVERLITRASMVVAAAALLMMMLQISADVLMRNLAGTAIPAISDMVSRYYMVAVSFLPLAATQIHNRHIEATVFTDKLRGLPRTVISVFTLIVSIGVFGLLTWGASQEALKQTARRAYIETGTLHFPTWPSYWILPISFGLMALWLAALLCGDDRSKTTEEEDEARWEEA